MSTLIFPATAQAAAAVDFITNLTDRATADFLVTMGCEEGQGYFFGRPMAAGDFEAKFLSAAAVAEVA